MKSVRDRPGEWLPPGKVAAVCFSVDDVHPGRSSDAYEAGGDLGSGVLGRLTSLLDANPGTRATVFVTPDWRERSPVVTRSRLAAVPLLRDRVHLTAPLRSGTMRIDRHEAFCAYLRSDPRLEVAVHGLHHLQRGPRPPREFEARGARGSARRLRRARALFDAARLDAQAGFCPPGWDLPAALLDALATTGFRWVSAARDIVTPIAGGARTAMSGPHGLALLAPEWTPKGLVHLPVNVQATSTSERALEIVEAGGLLSIKAHAVKDALGHVALDGLDAEYCERLHRLFERLASGYGDSLWWTTLDEVAERFRAVSSDAAAA